MYAKCVCMIGGLPRLKGVVLYQFKNFSFEDLFNLHIKIYISLDIMYLPKFIFSTKLFNLITMYTPVNKYCLLKIPYFS